METTAAAAQPKNQPKKKTQLSYIIRDQVEKLNRSGINCIKFEQNNNNATASADNLRLFTAGRDSIIRVYNNLSPNINSDNNADRFYQMSLSHHTDWVNDIVLCKDSKTLYSASSDTTVKVWNSTKGTLLNTLCLHKDYVKCLSYASERGDLIASAGFDKNIFIWDINTGVALNPTGSLDNQFKNISDNKYSIYSLAMNGQGTLLASGSPENCIRIWDPRTCQKAMKLKGHTHNIRSIILNSDGTQCLSASSDHTIRLWSLGQQRCISTIEIHTEGVWSMCVNDSFSKVYSGGKDCRVYLTDLRNINESVLICEETAPVLSMDFGHNSDSLWIATTNSTIKNWSLKQSDQSADKISPNSKQNKQQSASIGSVNLTTSEATDSLQSTSSILLGTNPVTADKSSSSSLSSSFLMQMTPLNAQPLITITGTASIKQYCILNDKRTIVTKDTDENVCVWDVLQARKLESLGKENYDNVIKQRQRFISIPNWFTVDLKLGLLTITLDESEWNSAWVNFKDMDSNHVRGTQNIDLTDAKVNYGCIFLESLFKNCLFINPLRVQTCLTVIYSPITNNKPTSDEEQNQAGLLRFNIPEHTPIIFSEVSGRTLHRTEVKELSKESEQETLSNVMPLWIIDSLVNKISPKFNRLVFILNLYNSNSQQNNSTSKTTANKDRLSSIDLLQVKKLKEHVYQKILKLDEQNTTSNDTNISVSNASSEVPTNQQQKNSISGLNGTANAVATQSANDLSTISNRSIELICSDTILNDSEMNLRTLKHLIWKGTGDLTILYRVKL